jgi:hypothetical protein
LETRLFYEIIAGKIFLLLVKFLHFAKSESQNGQVLHKLHKLVFDYLIQMFSESGIPEKHLSTDESVVLWKGQLGYIVYIPKKCCTFG